MPSEEAIEAAKRDIRALVHKQDLDATMGRMWTVDEFVDAAARAALEAVEALAPEPGKRLDPDFRADLVEFAKSRIEDVWTDAPEGVDAITLAQNVVAAQEWAWLARGFPVARVEALEEVEWEYGLYEEDPHRERERPHRAYNGAHLVSENFEHVRTQHRRGHPSIKFVRRRKAGPWEEVPADEHN